MTWPLQSASSWKLTLPCTRAQAEALAAADDALPGLDPAPVLMTDEPDPAAPDAWTLSAYFEGDPDAETLGRVRSLVSAPANAGTLERLDDEDWVTASQRGMAPVRAGRFFVHTPAHRGDVPADAVAFEIDAGRAFGTGHHETTSGCLEALDRLAERNFADIADIGTGTGLLAFAAHRLWPDARVIASDIDPVSIYVTRTNAGVNAVTLGAKAGQVATVVADGMGAPELGTRAPYDLLIANILAGPLIALAPSFAAALAPGGVLILAGLLDRQADAVADAYRAEGLRDHERVTRGDWPTLIMRKPAST